MTFLVPALILIFTSVAVENSGIPYAAAPGIAMAVNLLNRDVSYLIIFFALFMGYLTGSIFSYNVGSRGSYENMLNTLSDKRKDQLGDIIEGKLKKHIGFAIVSSKLVGQIRPFASYFFGYMHVPKQTFLIWTVLGSSIISLYDLLLAEFVFRLLRKYYAGYQSWFIIAAILLIIIPIFAVIWLRRKS